MRRRATQSFNETSEETDCVLVLHYHVLSCRLNTRTVDLKVCKCGFIILKLESRLCVTINIILSNDFCFSVKRAPLVILGKHITYILEFVMSDGGTNFGAAPAPVFIKLFNDISCDATE